MKRLRILPLVLLLFVLTSCSSGGSTPGGSSQLLIVVNAPFSKAPYLGDSIYKGVSLAVDEVNKGGGVKVGGTTYTFRTQKMDNALSPQTALGNVQEAVAEGAAAIVDEGTGVDASWSVANDAHVPIGIVYQGGEGLVDPSAKPNVFRITPTDHGIAFRYAEYLVPKGPKVAFLHDDSDYGAQGEAAFQDAFGHVPKAVAADISIPGSAPDVSPQVLEARRSGAGSLLVWARSSVVAEVVRAARSSGWDVPIYTAPSGEDPLVRQQLSDHPEWVDGLTFAAGRMTAEKGPGPFLAFQSAYVAAFGPDKVGVKNSKGEDVLQPPDYAMYPYDFVKLIAEAASVAQSTDGAKVIAALNQVDIQGANGDERGFNEKNHEGVVDDDVYFATFHDMVYAPVKDDPLSATLQVIPQT